MMEFRCRRSCCKQQPPRSMPLSLSLQLLVVLGVTLISSSTGFTAPSTTATTTTTTTRGSTSTLTTDSTSSTLVPVEIDDDVLNNPMFIQPLEDTKSNDGSVKRSTEELIFIAKKFLVGSNGLGGDPDMLADDFQFEGPVVGPLSKQEFVQAIGQVDFQTAFPNWKPEFYGFFVDPYEAEEGKVDDGEGATKSRVWYTARGQGMNSGPLLPFAPEPTNQMVVNPPQVCSLTIDQQTGLITKYTIGYVVDRSVGNTGGLGGLYGILYAIGKPLPFPEAQPWKKSWQYAIFQKIGALLR